MNTIMRLTLHPLWQPHPFQTSFIGPPGRRNACFNITVFFNKLDDKTYGKCCMIESVYTMYTGSYSSPLYTGSYSRVAVCVELVLSPTPFFCSVKSFHWTVLKCTVHPPHGVNKMDVLDKMDSVLRSPLTAVQ